MRHKETAIKIIETSTNEFEEAETLEVKDDNHQLETNFFDKENTILSQELEYSKISTKKFKLGNKEHLMRYSRSVSSKNASAPDVNQLCRGFEDQPCTCYYPDHPNVTLFEVDSDDTTQNASSVNGTGPASCEDLQSSGFKTAGFYVVRFKPKRVKVLYCSFNQTIESLINERQSTIRSS